MRSFAVLLALAACNSDPPSGGFAPPTTKPAVAEPTTAAAEPAADDNPLTKIYTQLDKEKAQRPNAGPTVESIVAKLAGTELAPVQLKQYVASTAHARYCSGGRAASGIHVAICEYASAADATAARDYVMTTFPELDANRLVVVKNATTITLTGAPIAETAAKYKTVLDGL